MVDYNPIRSVGGSSVKAPSVYQWKLQDISASEAGRTEDGTMDKMRIGQVVGIELRWNYVDTDTASQILKAFNPEYVRVCYLDAMAGKYLTEDFYVGQSYRIPVRLYPVDSSEDVILFVHGGCWTQGNLDTHEYLCQKIIKKLEMNVLAVDYRLAPEHPFPTPLDDVLEAYKWCAERIKTFIYAEIALEETYAQHYA